MTTEERLALDLRLDRIERKVDLLTKLLLNEGVRTRYSPWTVQRIAEQAKVYDELKALSE